MPDQPADRPITERMCEGTASRKSWLLLVSHANGDKS
jgi:hypothetical protein